jgi:hypothetical protein
VNTDFTLCGKGRVAILGRASTSFEKLKIIIWVACATRLGGSSWRASRGSSAPPSRADPALGYDRVIRMVARLRDVAAVTGCSYRGSRLQRDDPAIGRYRRSL